MTARHEREMGKIKSAHAAEIDSMRQHLESSHSKVLHDVSTNHQATVAHLQVSNVIILIYLVLD